MMKNVFSFFLPALAGIAGAVLLSCAGAPAGTGAGSGSLPPAQSQQIERVRVDYQGAAIGSDVPEWVQLAVDRDMDALAKLPRFEGKVPFVDEGQGQNLDLLRSWVNNFNIQASVSRRISTYVEAQFGGEQLGNKDSPENRNFLKEIVASFSNTTYSGIAKEYDYWIKLRTIDREKKTETEEYRYYTVYSMPEADLQYQIDVAMGKISARTQEQQEIKRDVEAAMKQAAFNSIQQAE